MEESNYSDRLKSIGRNDPCPCGSGKKYKKCHLIKDEETKHKEMKRLEEKMKAAKKDDKENEEEVDNKKDHKVTHSNFKNLPRPKMTKRDRLTNAPRRSAI